MSSAAAPLASGAFATPRAGCDFLLTEAHCRAVAERISGALRGQHALVVLTGDPVPRAETLAPAFGAAAQSRYRVIPFLCGPELGREALLRAASGIPPITGGALGDASFAARLEARVPLFLLEAANRLSDAQLLAIAPVLDPAVAAAVLLGEPGLAARLDGPVLAPLKERLAAALSFEQLGDAEIDPFIRHQLGSAAGSAFPPDVVAAIADAAAGDPALVNRLARLVLGYFESTGRTPTRSLFSRAPGDGEEAPRIPMVAAAPAETAAAPPRAEPGHKARRLGPAALLFLAFAAGVGIAGSGAALLHRRLWPAPAVVEAVPAAPRLARPALPAAEIALLLRRGDRFLATGDIASARLFYKRAAAVGDGQAALRLAETFDPDFLSRAGVRGVPGDPQLARQWYRRARELGVAPLRP